MFLNVALSFCIYNVLKHLRKLKLNLATTLSECWSKPWAFFSMVHVNHFGVKPNVMFSVLYFSLFQLLSLWDKANPRDWKVYADHCRVLCPFEEIGMSGFWQRPLYIPVPESIHRAARSQITLLLSSRSFFVWHNFILD